jgi:DNA polymerase-1
MTSRLLLIDALGFAYRAFYAIRDLAASDGRPTNAVFGFVKMLAQINRIWSPTHECVVFDGGIPEERRQLLPGYKAQRPPMPDALRSQLDDIREYLRVSAITSLRLDGKEADDIIASAAARARDCGCEVLIASADKDLFQIAAPNIALIAPGKIEEKQGPDEIRRKTGVNPEQVVEWLALTGDSSDNIPGVPGVGAKTAAKLLTQWGSLRGILDHLERIEPERIRRALSEYRADILRNVKLITLDKALPLPCPLEEMKVKPPHTDQLRSFYNRLEFHSLATGL